MMKPWKRIEPTTTLHDGWRSIIAKTFIKNDGQQARFETMVKEGVECVDIIALTPEHKVVVTWQFRVGPEQVMMEVPGGMVEPGEAPEEAAKRELREETGYQASGELEYIGKFYKDPYINATYHLYVAKGCVRVGEQQLDENEEVDVAELAIKEFLRLAKSEQTASSHIPALLVYDKLKELEEQ